MADLRINGWMLVHDTGDQKVATVGETVTSYRGETYTLTGGCPPHKPSSTGRAAVDDGAGGENLYYPSVFGMKWIVDTKPA